MMYQGTTQHGFAQYCQWGRMAKCLQMRKEIEKIEGKKIDQISPRDI